MKQYFVKYSLNHTSHLVQFSCAIDVEGKDTADNSASEILNKIAESHLSNHGSKVLYSDIILSVLTRLN